MSIAIKEVKMQDGSQKIRLDSPYHPELPKRAKAMGGKFNGDAKAWYFDLRTLDAVRQMCVSVYGIDPLAEPEEMVNVRIFNDIDNLPGDQTVWAMGREIISRPSRDASVRVGQGVAIVAGGFKSSGGSRNNPSIGSCLPGTVIEVFDVPRSVAEAWIASGWQDDAEIFVVEPAEETSVTFENAKVLAEQLSKLIPTLTEAQMAEIMHIVIATK